MESPNEKINQAVMGKATQEANTQGVPLGSGDLIDIQVADLPELKSIHARVTPAGTILLPLVGQLRVEGITAEELHDKLRTILGEKYLKNPQVSVSVSEMRSHKVAVMGQVNKPGVYDLSSHLRLSDAIGMAGGLKDDASPSVFVIRRAGFGRMASAKGTAASSEKERKGIPQQRTSNMVEIDLREILDGKNEQANIPLVAGDVIQVPPSGTVYVGGRVNNPKPVQIMGGVLTAQQAIVAAGGCSQIGDMHEVYVYRRLPDGQRQTIQLNFGHENRARVDFLLKKDDVLMVGTAWGAYVWGQFQNTVLNHMFFPLPY